MSVLARLAAEFAVLVLVRVTVLPVRVLALFEAAELAATLAAVFVTVLLALAAVVVVSLALIGAELAAWLAALTAESGMINC